MGIAQLSKLVKIARTFVNNHSTAIQWTAVGTATAGMWGGIFLVEKQNAEATQKVIDSLNEPPQKAKIQNVAIQPETQVCYEEGTLSEPVYPDESYRSSKILEKGIKRGEQADTIGNVVFDKGLVTSIEVNEDYGFGVDASPDGNSAYSVILSDGSRLEFVPQYETNRARVSKKDGALVFEGLNRMYFTNNHEEDDIKYSNIGKYKFFGCNGFVNTSGQAGEQITSGHRKFPDGTVQESRLCLTDNRLRVPEEKDIYSVTENDRMYGGN